MKLASMKDGSRDGRLLVVSRDLERAVPADDISPSLWRALEEWPQVESLLKDLSARLDADPHLSGSFAFDPASVLAPLPRAAQWCDGSAYLHHAELVRKARNAEMPEILYKEPLLYQGASDHFLSALDDIAIAEEAWGIDLEAEIAVVTDDVPMGTNRADAARHIRLLMVVNDVSLRNLIPSEMEKGFGFFTSKPATAFSQVAVTPDELGDPWDGAKLSLPLSSWVNGTLLGSPDTGSDLSFDFAQLIAHAATSRHLRAGTIIGSGTVSNRDLSRGSSCLQEKRMLEKIATGVIITPHLRFGDRVRIDMADAAGRSIFGAIDQRVVRYAATELEA